MTLYLKKCGILIFRIFLLGLCLAVFIKGKACLVVSMSRDHRHRHVTQTAE